MLHFKGKDWEPQVFAIAMAFAAFRVALGGSPEPFTLHEVLTWLKVRGS